MSCDETWGSMVVVALFLLSLLILLCSACAGTASTCCPFCWYRTAAAATAFQRQSIQQQYRLKKSCCTLYRVQHQPGGPPAAQHLHIFCQMPHGMLITCAKTQQHHNALPSK
jgi:hypothetical protein